MQKNNLKLETREIRFSLKTAASERVFLAGEFNNWNLQAHRIPINHGNESPDPPVVTKMVPCPPCTWG
jgi:hypothetical protein